MAGMATAGRGTGGTAATAELSDQATAPAGQVANQRRAGLLAAAAALDAAGAAIATAFDQVGALLEAGAWEGRAATAWAGELSEVRAGVARMLAGTTMDCAAAARTQPQWVMPDDPRAVGPATVPGPAQGGR